MHTIHIDLNASSIMRPLLNLHLEASGLRLRSVWRQILIHTVPNIDPHRAFAAKYLLTVSRILPISNES